MFNGLSGSTYAFKGIKKVADMDFQEGEYYAVAEREGEAFEMAQYKQGSLRLMYAESIIWYNPTRFSHAKHMKFPTW